jgi:hypothetical protein
MNPVHTVTPYLSKIHFDFIFPSTSWSHKCTVYYITFYADKDVRLNCGDYSTHFKESNISALASVAVNTLQD